MKIDTKTMITEHWQPLSDIVIEYVTLAAHYCKIPSLLKVNIGTLILKGQQGIFSRTIV